MAWAAFMILSSQRYQTQNTWPDRLQPDRRGLHCGTHSVALALARDLGDCG
jgi:hypothetical protein